MGVLCQPLIAFSEDVLGVNAMVACAATILIPLPLLYWMPETLGEKVE